MSHRWIAELKGGNLTLNPLVFKEVLGKLGNFKRTCYNVVEALKRVLAVSKHLKFTVGIPNVCETNMLIESYTFNKKNRLSDSPSQDGSEDDFTCVIRFLQRIIQNPVNKHSQESGEMPICVEQPLGTMGFSRMSYMT